VSLVNVGVLISNLQSVFFMHVLTCLLHVCYNNNSTDDF